MWRLLVIIATLLGGLLTAPAAVAQNESEVPPDLAAMLPTPDALPEAGYQLARGGYLTIADARDVLERRYALDDGAIERVLEGAAWQQAYTGTLVLLWDRAYLLADPLVTITVTIHELGSVDGATAIAALLTGAEPAGAEAREPAVDGATTWRVVTSRSDALLSVVRAGRYVVEVETAGHRQRPAGEEHTAVIVATLDRIAAEAGSGLSRRFVPVDDSRLIPMSVATEYPLAHLWYRLLDGEVIPAAGELDPPAPSDIAAGVDTIAIQRQTAELASQTWVTAGVVLAEFAAPADASAFDGVIRDPLDFFPTTEDSRAVDSIAITGRVDAIAGATRVGGRYSGYRITIVVGDTVAQLVIRTTDGALVAQDAAERWADAQRTCLVAGACDAVPLGSLLKAPNPSMPAGSSPEDGIYRSPVAPWSVSFDPTVWRVADTFAEGGYDYLYLRATAMDATFETIVDHRGDPEQCVLGELDRLRKDEAHARISVGSGDPDEAPGGLTVGHGWIVYTVEPLEDSRAEQEYVVRIDCYTVEPGAISLVMQARAPHDRWAAVAPQASALRSRIEIEGVPVGRKPGDLPGVASIARSDEMINRRPWVGIAA